MNQKQMAVILASYSSASAGVLSLTLALTCALGSQAAPSNASNASNATPFANAKTPPMATQPSDAPNAVPDQIIVTVHPGTSDRKLQESLKDLNGTIIDQERDGKMFSYLVKVDKSKMAEAMKKAKQDKNFDAVAPNSTAFVQFSKSPNDPGYATGLQSYLQQMNVPAAWALGAAGQGIVMGSLDTGVDFSGPELSGRQAFPGFNVPQKKVGGEETDKSFGHGTFTMGCFGCNTNNDQGFASPAFQSMIVPIVITDAQGRATDWSIGRGLNILRKKRVKLANLSFNAKPPYTLSDPVHPFLHKKIARFAAAGGVIFNAAGNSGTEDGSGVKQNGLVVVSGVDPSLNPSKFSTYGPAVSFAGPAENIANTGDNNQAFVGATGTSFAAPLAAGVAAQIWSMHPTLPASTVLQIMAQTAHVPSGGDPLKYGAGIPDAAAAINLANTSF
ncbi:MAG TPA: S8 family serine peptidase [Oculatellaceae cyanobacterium]